MNLGDEKEDYEDAIAE